MGVIPKYPLYEMMFHKTNVSKICGHLFDIMSLSTKQSFNSRHFIREGISLRLPSKHFYLGLFYVSTV